MNYRYDRGGVKSASICLASKRFFLRHFVLYDRLKDQLMPPYFKKMRDGDLVCITNKNIQGLPKKMLCAKMYDIAYVTTFTFFHLIDFYH